MNKAHRYRDIQQSSFSNLSVALSTSQIILQPFCRFTYATAHSQTLPSLYLRHSSFSNPSVALPTSQLILQPFCRFTYVTTRSPPLSSFFLRHSSFSIPSASLHLRHNSFSIPFVGLPTSQLILQPLRCFTYVTVHSPTSLSLLLRHKLFT